MQDARTGFPLFVAHGRLMASRDEAVCRYSAACAVRWERARRFEDSLTATPEWSSRDLK
jgi:hypothetical protein